MADAFIGSLVDIVGAPHVLVDPDLTHAYRTDWTGRWSGQCRAVVRPADTAETAAVVTACAEARVPIIPQGGNTGLVGATVPDLVSWEWRTENRKGLSRLDYTQNAVNKTLVAPYSPRAAVGAPVSVPITWDELDDPDLRPDR